MGGSSDRCDGEIRSEPTEITDVAGHDDRALAPSGQDHGRVDHVRCRRTPTKDAGRLRQKLIERENLVVAPASRARSGTCLAGSRQT
jgi:hypothetical protein